MKKYFLLASVAGCLMTANAWAGTIATGGASATINVKANLKPTGTITSVADMDFGDILVTQDTTQDVCTGDIATLGTDGVINAGILLAIVLSSLRSALSIL